MKVNLTVQGQINSQEIALGVTRTIDQHLGQIISDEVTQMKIRISQGRDVKNESFKRYSPKYKDFREAKGRQTSPVDLTFTGKMLASITHNIQPKGDTTEATVFFGSAAEALKAKGNIENGRNFFGFTQEQLVRIQDKLRKVIKG